MVFDAILIENEKVSSLVVISAFGSVYLVGVFLTFLDSLGNVGITNTTDISVSGNYNCNSASPSGCWFKIQMTYTGGAATQANDTTTWDASIAGDPVRLVK